MAGRTRLVLLDAGAVFAALDQPAGWPGNPRREGGVTMRVTVGVSCRRIGGYGRESATGRVNDAEQFHAGVGVCYGLGSQHLRAYNDSRCPTALPESMGDSVLLRPPPRSLYAHKRGAIRIVLERDETALVLRPRTTSPRSTWYIEAWTIATS